MHRCLEQDEPHEVFCIQKVLLHPFHATFLHSALLLGSDGKIADTSQILPVLKVSLYGLFQGARPIYCYCPRAESSSGFPSLRYTQKTREGCGCFRGLFGGSRGKLRETLGKIAGKNFPESRNASNSRILGTGKGKPVGNLRSTLPRPCPHLPCVVVFEIDSSGLLEFFRYAPNPQETLSSPQMWVWPQLSFFKGSPHPPQTKALPSPPSPLLFPPPPLALFAMLRDGAAQAGVGGGVLGEGPPAVLGARPTSGVLDS